MHTDERTMMEADDLVNLGRDIAYRVGTFEGDFRDGLEHVGPGELRILKAVLEDHGIAHWTEEGREVPGGLQWDAILDAFAANLDPTRDQRAFSWIEQDKKASGVLDDLRGRLDHYAKERERVAGL